MRDLSSRLARRRTLSLLGKADEHEREEELRSRHLWLVRGDDVHDLQQARTTENVSREP